jgi:hypothetical protein
LSTSPVEIRECPVQTNSDFADELGERLLAKYTGRSARKSPMSRLGSIALLQSFEQRPVDSFFASAGIADARTSASEISARRARRCATSAVPWNQSFRMWRYERMNGCSWPQA